MGLLDNVTGALGIGGAGSVPQIQFNPWDINTALGSATFQDGSASASLSPELQGISGSILGQYQNMVDPSNLGQIQGLLGQMFQPQFDRQSQSQESRLLNQGLLGSTTGMLQQQATQQAQNQSLINATLGAQNQMFKQAQGLLGQYLNVNQLPLQLMQMGGQLGALQMDADSFNVQAQLEADKNKAGFFSNLLGAGIGGAFNAGLFGGNNNDD